MPENTWRCSPPRSKVSCNSLSAPSTACAAVIFATRSSTLLKSSMLIVVLSPLACSLVFAALAAAAGAVSASADAAIKRSKVLRSIRASSGWNLLI